MGISQLVIFYNSQCDDMIAVTGELFHIYRLLPMLLHSVSLAAKCAINTTT